MNSPTVVNHVDHIDKLKSQMLELVDHLRRDVTLVTDPKAQALFETSAEVVTGLVKAFDDCVAKKEAAWRPVSADPTASLVISQMSSR